MPRLDGIGTGRAGVSESYAAAPKYPPLFVLVVGLAALWRFSPAGDL
jgi:hypothetical protein